MLGRLFGALAWAVLASPLWANDEVMSDGYKIPVLPSRPPWLAIVFTLVLLGALCAATFKNANRTHLD